MFNQLLHIFHLHMQTLSLTERTLSYFVLHNNNNVDNVLKFNSIFQFNHQFIDKRQCLIFTLFKVDNRIQINIY